MKKVWILSLGLSLTALTLTSQAQTTKDIKFGIKAGANLMMGGKYNLAGTSYTTEFSPGFQAGTFVEIPLSDKVSFMPEVIYSQKVSKLKETVSGTTGELKSKVGYIDVPVLFAYNATPELHFMLGPQASFLTNQSTKTYVNGTQTASSTDTDDLRKAIAGGVVGLGYRINPNINVNARYSMDFQSAGKESVNQDKARFSGFALSLGYSF